MHLSLLHSSPHQRHCLLRALALASLAIAGIALPFVWDFLAAINSMPKMHWLQQMLEQMPATSWLMMFVWGAAIPGVLLWSMHQQRHHKLMTVTAMLALMWIAITWYVHMPSSGQCTSMYAQWAWACTALQWAYSMSLGIATATYVFVMLALGLSALGLLAEGLDEKPAHAS